MNYRRFIDYQHKFQKKYSTNAEASKRYQIFLESLARIETKNSNSTNKIWGLTQFSDMTKEEFRSNYLLKNTIKTGSHNPKIEVNKPTKLTAPPTSFDWRTKNVITPVKDQQQCGSCWAFSVAETAESAYILAGKANVTTLRVSEQQIVDCDSSDDGCNGGNPETAWQYIIGAGGLDSEASYPYTAEDGTCQFKKQDVVASVSSWKYACDEEDETTLQQNLLLKPISICVDAEYWSDYTSGIMTGWECAWINELDHCVQLVGYDTTGSTPFWIVRNSWGPSWGENGYIRLQMWDNTCGLTNEATIPSV